MTFEKLKTNKAVLYARLLGFEPFGNAETATRHFHWYMPEGDDTFSVHQYAGIDGLSYTVNRESTSSLEHACKFLQKIERKQEKAVSPEWADSADWLRANKHRLKPDSTR